ncbi:CAP domain-containing protein [Pseudomonas sp. BJa5]|uniref:CAP domain-containing protein n=1 Tax=Pseudomonas sp. BJa5 TaxID=2936270 RepID=UPI0025599995|nr:CAP domain-containing protein [Pseudomonas sp. BGr12]MDL2419557.1 CAP domain-containing protein [Pseudomonas sp. BGr12]
MRGQIIKLMFLPVIVVTVAGMGCPQGGTSNGPADRILSLINQKRVAAGCKEVFGNGQLWTAADRHANDMAYKKAHLQTGTDGHTGTDGSRPEQRITQAGYTPYSRIGEIIYWKDNNLSQNEEVATVDWWMNSPPHRAIMLDCQFTDAGVALYYPGGTSWYTTVDFGKK